MDTNQLMQMLVEVTGTPEVRTNPQLRLFETQVLDSMRTVDLLLALEEQCGISISPAEFDRDAWATPEQFLQDVEARMSAP